MQNPLNSSPLSSVVPLFLCLLLVSLSGCQNASGPAADSSPAPTKIKLAYLGLTCEAAMFVAQEKGFFKDEGIEVEFVKTDWDGLRDGLGMGWFDANYTLIMYLLKPIEQGLNVKITGGIHSGCLRVQTGPDSSVKTLADLKGKKIGIPTMGSPPFLFASRALAAQGLDPRTDVTWVVVAPEVTGLALDNGQIDAVADSEPLGSILGATKNLRTLADQAVDAPYNEEYCCASVVSGKFLERDPIGVAKITRALLKGAMWVHQNPMPAAELSVSGKYVASTAEINGHALGKLTFTPGVSKCRESLLSAALEMKRAGLLNDSTDPTELAKRAWVDLEGVNNEWLQTLQVETVAGGGRQAPPDPLLLAKLFMENQDFQFLCCDLCVTDSTLCAP